MNEPLRFINQLKGLTFHIDKYQRGYRWGIREIHSLLKDIYTFDNSKESYYCLQPLVLREKSQNNFELIDGQQRCTTIYLILKYLLKEDFYEIKYETRGNDDGLNLFLSAIDQFALPHLDDISDNELDKAVSLWWKTEFIVQQQVADTVDNFFFFKAWCIVARWLAKDNYRKAKLRLNLLDHTKVIWYLDETEADETANTFINFNDGKISLDEAELVKGLYVLDFVTIADQTRRSYEENQFADDWNNIEQHLKVPSFWNFVHNERDNRVLANKITLLLQIEKGKTAKAEDLFYTYRAYEEAFLSADKPKWRTLTSLYNQLEEWYHDRATYHLMGAVVHLTETSVHEIIVNYQKSSKKDELDDYLKGILRQKFYKKTQEVFKDQFNPDELKYAKPGIFPTLLLYNIAVAHLSDKQYRFPFDIFKEVALWNIEHIYAKNSKGFAKTEDLRDWHKELGDIMATYELYAQPEFEALWTQIDFDDLEKSNALVVKIEQLLLERLDKDSLTNLCFLDNVTNIQVGNKVFKKKRDMILELEGTLDEGSYVPMASKQLFQKSLTASEKVRLNYWNTADRDAYLEDIKKKIKAFLN